MTGLQTGRNVSGQQIAERLPVALLLNASDDVTPDCVQAGEVIGVGEVAVLDLQGRQLGAVPSENIGKHGKALSLVRFVVVTVARDRHGSALCFDARLPGEFGSWPGSGLWVGQLRGGGERADDVGVGAAGHCRVQPLAALASCDQCDRRCHRPALGGVGGAGVAQVSGPVAGVSERVVFPLPTSCARVAVQAAAHGDAAVVVDGLDAQRVAVGDADGAIVRAGCDDIAAAGACAGRKVDLAAAIDEA